MSPAAISELMRPDSYDMLSSDITEDDDDDDVQNREEVRLMQSVKRWQTLIPAALFVDTASATDRNMDADFQTRCI